ncbi:hypothetical protein PF008_g6086 [Phytophthora fragariae]|uniref:CCHC-type domain-containing protein n=1 Tax=Phytophthora fragariae TaxID=53985 RepID=A0A6G0S8A6_9STRA|nr:hypothetical protein PF008_g6086 [Phytophthora fragariae]
MLQKVMSSMASTSGLGSGSSASTATPAFTTKLCKFNGTGYRVCVRQLQLYLEAKDAWEAVLKLAPTELQLTAEGADFGDRPLHQLSPQQKLVMTIILDALSDEQAALLADLEHPQPMLSALRKTYRHVCDATTRLMLADLECYKVSLSDGEKKNNFLQSLGPDWNGYVGSLETRPTFEDLLIKAASDTRRHAVRPQRGKRGGGSVVRGGNAFTAKYDGKKKGKYFNCGKRGHSRNECKSEKRASTCRLLVIQDAGAAMTVPRVDLRFKSANMLVQNGSSTLELRVI